MDPTINFFNQCCQAITSMTITGIAKTFNRLRIKSRETATIIKWGTGHLVDTDSGARYFTMEMDLLVDGRHLRTVADMVTDHTAKQFSKHVVKELLDLGVHVDDDIILMAHKLKPPVKVDVPQSALTLDHARFKLQLWLCVPHRLQNGLPIDKKFHSTVVKDQGKPLPEPIEPE